MAKTISSTRGSKSPHAALCMSHSANPQSFLTFLAAAVTGFPCGALRSSPAHRVSARLSGRAKGTSGIVSITVNRHEELSDCSAPYADFGHGSLFEAAPGARQFCGATELSARSHFMPIEMRMEGGGLHARISIGEKQLPAEWRRALQNLRALDSVGGGERTPVAFAKRLPASAPMVWACSIRSLPLDNF